MKSSLSCSFSSKTTSTTTTTTSPDNNVTQFSAMESSSSSSFSSSTTTTTTSPDNNVWLFYPNLIGYGRIVLAVMAMYWMSSSPGCAMLCYALSAGLDAFDGWAARTYNQSSRFGAMLDQLTDRCALLALVMALCKLFPDHLFWLQLSAVIDIASHWLHLHATDLSGATSHKQSSNWLLNLYYTDRMFLGFMCGGNEAFYILLYIRAFWAGPLIFGAFHFMSIFPLLAFPIAFVKSGISLVHLYTAAEMVVAHDVKLRVEAAQKAQ